MQSRRPSLVDGGVAFAIADGSKHSCCLGTSMVVGRCKRGAETVEVMSAVVGIWIVWCC